MADAKDILGLTGDGKSFADAVPTQKKFKEPAPKKPEGVSREVYALTSGQPNPIMSSISFRKQSPAPTSGSKPKVTWRWSAFKPGARSPIDTLQLYHWVKVTDGVAPTTYAFDKYNRHVELVQYSDDEYSQLLQDPKWSKEETDHLFSLLARFDLRFVAAADRFECGRQRTVEELKERYYSVARKLIIQRAADLEDMADHPLVKEEYKYNMAHEVERKKAMAQLLNTSRQQEKEEQETIAEAKRIQDARRNDLEMKLRAEKAKTEAALANNREACMEHLRRMSGDEAAPANLAAPGVRAPVNAIFTQQQQEEARKSLYSQQPKHVPRVFLRGQRFNSSIAQLAATQGQRNAKRIDQMLDELGVRSKPKVPTRTVTNEHEKLRKAISFLFAMQKKVQQKEFEVKVLRQNPEADVEAALLNAARSGVLGDKAARVSTRGTSSTPGDDGDGAGDAQAPPRIGKRTDKRKAPARFGEDPSPTQPQQKRARKQKVHED